MICPQCGAGNPEGARQCSKCDAMLVEGTSRSSGDKAEGANDIVVLETTDETRLLAARSLLEAEGIPCNTRGEEGRSLIGAGPMRLSVTVANEAAARALLASRG